MFPPLSRPGRPYHGLLEPLLFIREVAAPPPFYISAAFSVLRRVDGRGVARAIGFGDDEFMNL